MGQGGVLDTPHRPPDQRQHDPQRALQQEVQEEEQGRGIDWLTLSAITTTIQSPSNTGFPFYHDDNLYLYFFYFLPTFSLCSALLFLLHDHGEMTRADTPPNPDTSLPFSFFLVSFLAGSFPQEAEHARAPSGLFSILPSRVLFRFRDARNMN